MWKATETCCIIRKTGAKHTALANHQLSSLSGRKWEHPRSTEPAAQKSTPTAPLPPSPLAGTSCRRSGEGCSSSQTLSATSSIASRECQAHYGCKHSPSPSAAQLLAAAAPLSVAQLQRGSGLGCAVGMWCRPQAPLPPGWGLPGWRSLVEKKRNETRRLTESPCSSESVLTIMGAGLACGETKAACHRAERQTQPFVRHSLTRPCHHRPSRRRQLRKGSALGPPPRAQQPWDGCGDTAWLGAWVPSSGPVYPPLRPQLQGGRQGTPETLPASARITPAPKLT